MSVFKKSQRLLKKGEFRSVLEKRNRFETKHFIIFSSPNEKITHRLGLIMSRKVGKAVIRNKVKRIIREYFRRHLKYREGSLDIIFIGKKNLSSSLKFGDVYKEMEAFCEKNFYIPHNYLSVDSGRTFA